MVVVSWWFLYGGCFVVIVVWSLLCDGFCVVVFG